MAGSCAAREYGIIWGAKLPYRLILSFSSTGEHMNRSPRWPQLLAVLALCLVVSAPAAASSTTFRITLPAQQAEPLTGRLFVMIARANDPEPRLQVGSWRSRTE